MRSKTKTKQKPNKNQKQNKNIFDSMCDINTLSFLAKKIDRSSPSIGIGVER